MRLLTLSCIPTVEDPTSVLVSKSSRNGGSLDLICSITLAQAIPNGAMLEVVWTDSNGSLSSGTLSAETNTFYSTTLSLSSVTVSDAGTYTCTATLTSTRTYLISSTSTIGYTNVTVQRKFLM